MMTAEIILTIFFLLLVNYLFFLLKIYRGFNSLSRPGNNAAVNDEFISVIIPFRNEAESILRNLKSIETLDYPQDRFEVIYVNDHSEDDSVSILRQNISKQNIQVLDAPDYKGSAAHKKFALSYALSSSKGGIIVTTDADCVYTPEWLNLMISAFGPKTGLVSGPVMFNYGTGLFSRLQALEFIGLITAGAGLIGSGSPVICNAANLAYRKKAFDDAGGYSGQMNLSSGDDELLMQKIDADTEYGVTFCPDPRAIVRTEANETLGQFYNQRKRWASKGLFYNKRIMIKLLLIFLFYLSLIISLIFAFTNIHFFLYLVTAFILKTAAEYFVLSTGNRRLFHTKLLRYLLPAELLQIPYIIAASIGGLFGRFNWKNRRIKR